MRSASSVSGLVGGTLLLLSAVLPASAQDARLTRTSRAPFAKVASAMEQGIADAKMALVCHANAQRGAAARGVSIRGNQVMMVFRNDLAVRLRSIVEQAVAAR